MEENTRVSEQYRKAYNQADIICQYMPHLLENMIFPERQYSEYTKGFQDRIRQFNQDRDAMKDISIKDIKSIYGKKTNKYKDKGLDKD